MTKYLQRAWSDSINDISMNDVQIAIKEMMAMDDEHGAIWVGTEDGAYVLEADKSLKIFFVVDEEQFIYQAQSIQEVESLFKLILNEDFETLAAIVK